MPTIQELLDSGEWYDDFTSSNVQAFRYSVENRLLNVRFNDGSLYTYFNVPQSTFESFVRARSKGSFVWSYLRGVFQYQHGAQVGEPFKQRLPGAPNLPTTPDLQRRKTDIEASERLKGVSGKTEAERLKNLKKIKRRLGGR